MVTYQNFDTTPSLNAISVTDDEVIKIVRGLDINKAQGNDELLVRTIKICDTNIIRPLYIIYRNGIESSIFVEIW